MSLPQRRNQKKYKRRKITPMSGTPMARLVDRQVEPEKPFNLDDPQPTFEDWLNEIPTVEGMLLADENDRLLVDNGGDYYPDDDEY